MVGDSAGLRQESDSAKQAFASLSQKAGGLQGGLDRASDDQKSFIEGQIASLKGQIAGAGSEVNRTSSAYSSSIAQERTEELKVELDADQKRVAQQEREAEEMAVKEQAIASRSPEASEADNEDLVFLSESFGTAGDDPVASSNSSAGAQAAAAADVDTTEKKDDPATKAIGGTGSASS